ncbi:MAG: hypothetical protein WD066_14130 [Planctomycetaceae bacterium]
MPTSPTEDIRAIRHQLAARFDNDLDAIVVDLRRQERESNRRYVALPKRPPQRLRAAEVGSREDVTGESPTLACR